MSLLSKLLGDKKKVLTDIVDLIQRDAQTEQPAHPNAAVNNVWSAQNSAVRADTASDGPSGVSWGSRMPDEPNQYNYPGSFEDYFADIFNREFADYRVERRQNPRSRGAYTYTLTKNAVPCLVVELLSERNEVYQVRDDCRHQGIPYLRFYYDHKGWWNTRAYVTERMRKALGC